MSAPRLTQAAPSPSSADSRRRHRVKALPRPGGGTERLLATFEEEGGSGRGAGEGESPRAGLRRAPKKGVGPSLGRRPTPVRSPPRRGPALRREQGLSRPGHRYPGPQTAPKATRHPVCHCQEWPQNSNKRPQACSKDSGESCPGGPRAFQKRVPCRSCFWRTAPDLRARSGPNERGACSWGQAPAPRHPQLSRPDLGDRRRADGTPAALRSEVAAGSSQHRRQLAGLLFPSGALSLMARLAHSRLTPNRRWGNSGRPSCVLLGPELAGNGPEQGRGLLFSAGGR